MDGIYRHERNNKISHFRSKLAQSRDRKYIIKDFYFIIFIFISIVMLRSAFACNYSSKVRDVLINPKAGTKTIPSMHQFLHQLSSHQKAPVGMTVCFPAVCPVPPIYLNFTNDHYAPCTHARWPLGSLLTLQFYPLARLPPCDC